MSLQALLLALSAYFFAPTPAPDCKASSQSARVCATAGSGSGTESAAPPPTRKPAPSAPRSGLYVGF
jgi:hypothetical protein